MRYKLVKTPSDMYRRFKDSQNPTCHFCYCAGDEDKCNFQKRAELQELLGDCTPDGGVYHYEMIKCIVPLNVSIL